MASSSNALKRNPSTEEQFNEEEFQDQIKAVKEATNPDEYESRLDKIGSTVSKWMKLIFNRDFSKEEFKAEWLSIDEYKSMADESMMNAWRVVNLPDWVVEKKGSQKGDIVESRKALTWYSSSYLDAILRVSTTKMKADVKKLASHEVTENPHSYICCGVSVTVPGYPPVKDLVRGHNKVGCWYLRPKTVTSADGDTEHTTFQWLMCCDLKGKIPQFVLDAAFATVMLDSIKHVRKFIADSKAAGKY
ncbi:Carotenoid-binding protein transcript variant 8 [Operophtera brumata]|uniref:Carotenoid-binding protein transcript variant 8 n=1 Tax=Operophtera brumata TaxID=104452 RepID=A0A0L7LGI6_OPEBR|nr:Carotenoid-binding protein transcript variant 8 [Operophtera brumata]